MKNRFLKPWMIAGLLAFSMAAGAEDIDLFMVPTPDGADKPNVLIIVDNTANWTPAFTNEMAALAETFAALPEDKFRIGIMFAAESGKVDNSVQGGYVRAAVRLMTSDSKTKYANLITSLHVRDDKGNSGQSSLVMAEAYRYLSGGVPNSGNGKGKTDYTGNTYGTFESKAIYALPNNALASKNALQYNTPVTGCEKNFIIYISNGASQDNSILIAQANAMLEAAATEEKIADATAPIAVSPSGSQDNASDEWARFMKKSKLGVTTYTIDVDKATTGQGPGWTAILKSMADTSKGKYFDVSSAGTGDAIRDAMNSILSEIQAVNSVFAAVSLPVSVNTQGTYLNQVFVGMFRPDGTSLPRWAGNLKQYKLGYAAAGNLTTLDADDKDAISSGGTGFISECARAFWTPSAVDNYWSFQPQGGCLTVLNSDVSNYPDGNIVEKGAQAYKLRGGSNFLSESYGDRDVFTCSGSCTSLIAFDTNIAPDKFGLLVLDTFTRDLLVKWGKGKNNATAKTDPDWVTSKNNITNPAPYSIRPSVHGDVVHSRPVAINFGTDAAPKVVVFYGGNDGLLRAVNGNRDGGLDIGSKGPGMELWSFMAPEFFRSIKRIRDNKTTISFLGNPITSPTPLPKPYGFDGAVSAYQGGGKTWIYATMRRGGRAFYAFDVTNPASPVLKWKRGCDDTGCSSGFDGIGQTWSAPQPLQAKGYGSGASPMLIMGGGYDTCEDYDNSTTTPSATPCTTPTKGSQIYVMDANTGTRLKTLDTDRGVVGDVFVVPDSSGLAKYAYAADLGGNVYRISGKDANTPFESTPPSEWTITKIAALGCDTAGTCSPNRKFIFAPDVVEDNGKYVLMIGSGDREKPLSDYTSAASVSNYFFMLKDDPSDAKWLPSESANCGAEVICLNSLYLIGLGSASPTYATVDEKKGWYLALNPKEQVVTSAITIFGTVSFSTHQPAEVDPEACTSNLGTARVYNVAYANGASMNGTGSRFQEVAGGGLPPSPVGGMVTLDNGETVPFCIGCNPESPLKGANPPPPPMAYQPKSRVYWHIQP